MGYICTAGKAVQLYSRHGAQGSVVQQAGEMGIQLIYKRQETRGIELCGKQEAKSVQLLTRKEAFGVQLYSRQRYRGTAVQ